MLSMMVAQDDLAVWRFPPYRLFRQVRARDFSEQYRVIISSIWNGKKRNVGFLAL